MTLQQSDNSLVLASGIKFDEEQVVVDASGIKFVEVGHPPFQAGLGDHPIVAVGIQPDHQLAKNSGLEVLVWNRSGVKKLSPVIGAE